MRKWTLVCVAGMLTAGMLTPAAASAVERQVQEDYVTLAGAAGPGPAGDNQVHVLRVGPPSARPVLVLVPGQFGAAGDFRFLARELAGRGHSWGAPTALAYAAWDFDGRAGYRDLSGPVLIDGGVHDAFAGEGDVYRLSVRDAADRLKRIAAGEVFDPALTMGRTETFTILQQLAGQYAKAAPNAPSALAAHLPEALRPPTSVTNLGLLDWLFVAHPLVADISVNPAYTRLPVLADAMAGPVPSSFEWYWPERLTLDLEATDAYGPTPAADLLGLRLWHTHDIDVPLYSFQTGLTRGTVNTATQWVVANSKIPAASYDGDNAMIHLDVVWADPQRNTMVRSAVPFLRQLNGR